MTFRSNTDEILETLNWDNKTRYRKASMYYGKKGSTEHSKGNKTLPEKWLQNLQKTDKNR